MKSVTVQLTKANQVAVNAVLIAIALWLAWSGSRRAVFLIALVPMAFVPFSFTRLKLQRLLAAHVAGAVLWFAASAGVLFDWIMVAQTLTARQTPDGSLLSAPAVVWIGPVWFSAHALLLLGYGITGLARLVTAPVRRFKRPPAVPAGAGGIGRRELLHKAGLLGAALPFGVSVSSVPLSYDFRVETREILLPDWPSELDGLRVVHLSDIHVGGMMDRTRLRRVAELTNGCEPDLVLHTGDFLTHRSGDFDDPLYEALALMQARYGQWACLGNHDYDDTARLERRMHASGVTVLRNRIATLSIGDQPLEIAGLDFVFGRLTRSTIYEQIVGRWERRSRLPRILLNHDPSAFAELPQSCADLVLSGHTHGGHIGVQLDSSRAVTVIGLVGLPDQGIFDRGDMRMYVTRCVGFYGYPMRIGIPPEVALLVLRAGGGLRA
jgi:predicted MPP superfamily phosphohydrolase